MILGQQRLPSARVHRVTGSPAGICKVTV
jgi:hypothetical protein